jgi:hypothetical protein
VAVEDLELKMEELAVAEELVQAFTAREEMQLLTLALAVVVSTLVAVLTALADQEL